MSKNSYPFCEIEKNGKVVEYISTVNKYIQIAPTLSIDLKCNACGGADHITAIVDPKSGPKRVWICANRHCKSNQMDCIPKRGGGAFYNPPRSPMEQQEDS